MLRIFRNLMANQWVSMDAIRALQIRKLRRLLDISYEKVPYYRRLFKKIGIVPADIQSVEDLAVIPITSKADLQALPVSQRMNIDFQVASLASEHSSGSTGRPFRVYYDPFFVRVRNLLFLRGLLATKYKLGRKLHLVTDPGKNNKWWLRWSYSSLLDDPEILLAKLNRARPHVLYGCRTPLYRMAECIQNENAKVPPLNSVVSTAEMLDAVSRERLKDAFCAEVFDFYGLTEMGLLGWECDAHNGYHLSEDSVIVEFIPVDTMSGLSRLVLTNLDLLAMPLIRYDSGDLGVRGESGGCPCGRNLAMLQRVEGRFNDCLVLADGRVVSPYRLTCAIEKVPGILQFQLVQTDLNRVQLKLIAKNTKTNNMDTALIRRTLRSILGDDMHISVDLQKSLDPQPGEKFRVVECRVTTGPT